MIRLATAIIGCRAAAEDIVQDAFATLLQRYDAIANPGGYLRVSVVHACRSWQRRQTRERAVMHTVRIEPVLDVSAAELDDLLSGLPPRQRLTLELHFIERWSTSEIATVCATPLNTVKSDVRRALATLRHRLT